MPVFAQLTGAEGWWWPVATAAAAAILAYVVHLVVNGVLRRAVKPHSLVLHSLLTSVKPAAGVALPLFAMQVAWQAMPDDLPRIDGIRHANAVLLIAAVTWVAMRVISGIADGIMARHPTDVADNLQARRIETQTLVLSRSAQTLAIIGGAAMVLMTFPGARQVGASLLASAGVLGIIGGLAARPVFSNLIAGLQIALAQPLRYGDVLIVKDQWGRVEEITGTYVVMRLWDDRRMVVPLNWFIENPFENWTRTTAALTGVVMLHLDFRTPVAQVRERAKQVVEAAPEWDKRAFAVQVTEATEQAMQVRILLTAADSGKLFDLRCRVREEMITWLAREHPESLPRIRQANEDMQPDAPAPR